MNIINEANSIANKYRSPDRQEIIIAEMKRLDRSVSASAQSCALAVGIVGALILGLGMCCVMVWDMMLLGIILGVPGIAVCMAAYPIYIKVTKNKKAAVAPRILELSKQMNDID